MILLTLQCRKVNVSINKDGRRVSISATKIRPKSPGVPPSFSGDIIWSSRPITGLELTCQSSCFISFYESQGIRICHRKLVALRLIRGSLIESGERRRNGPGLRRASVVQSDGTKQQYAEVVKSCKHEDILFEKHTEKKRKPHTQNRK